MLGSVTDAIYNWGPTLGRYAAGACCFKAAYDVSTGDKTSLVGKRVLPEATKREFTWQRTLLGVSLVGAGTLCFFGKLPYSPFGK